MDIRELAKIKAFQSLGSNATNATKAGVFCGYNGTQPVCNCNLLDYNDHHVNCKFQQVNFGYNVYKTCLARLTR